MLRRANSNCCLAGTEDLSVKEARELIANGKGLEFNVQSVVFNRAA